MNAIGKTPKVSICVVTYNHEKYIHRCLQSIVDQETDFDFEVIVADDCSTDGTREIVQQFAEKYPHLCKALLHEKNVGPTRNYLSVHAMAAGELIAHCDGDDYWLPTKLQVQTDFMEHHPACNVSGHRMYLTDESHVLSEDGRGNFPAAMDISAFYKHGNFLPHSSTMYRASCGRIPDVKGETMDFLLHIWRVKDGKIGFINQYLGVYLRHRASLTARSYHSLQHFKLNMIALEEIHKIVKNADEFERNKFVLSKECIKNFIADGRIELAREVAMISREFIAKKRYSYFLTLMVFFRDFIGLAVRTKRKYLSSAAWSL